MESSSPKRAGLVLAALILVAAVANLNLAVANVALPDIGKAFDSGQTTLNLIAVGYSLGLATSVLYLGALGDRYGRKMMLLLGMGLSIPASLLAGFAPSDERPLRRPRARRRRRRHGLPDHAGADHRALVGQRRGPARSRSGRRSAARSPRSGRCSPAPCSSSFDWGSVFLVTLPLAALALFMAWRYVPAHVNETTEPVDNLGGILSILLVAALVLGINFAPVPGKGTLAIGLGLVAIAATGGLRDPPAAGALAALRPRGRRAADLLGRRLRRDHRLRLADGGDVHRPAVPPERARLLDPRLRPGDPAGGGADGRSSRPARRSWSRRAAPASPC